MLRTNLATKPFYNERAVQLGLIATALVLAIITAWNTAGIVQLSGRQAELSAQFEQDDAKVRELQKKAQAIRAAINQTELETVVTKAAEANTILDQRAFSWTELFNHVESTIPPDVMLLAVRPAIEKGVIFMTFIVVGKEIEAIDTFMERLEETGAFSGMLSAEEQATDDGMYRATLQGRYQPSTPAPKNVESPATAGAGE